MEFAPHEKTVQLDDPDSPNHEFFDEINRRMAKKLLSMKKPEVEQENIIDVAKMLQDMKDKEQKQEEKKKLTKKQSLMYALD